MVITGVETTLPLFRDLMNEPDVINGDYSIHWLEKNLQDKTEAEGRP
jgi:acetyl-CoA carboxylase biotin carboxylase subunit